MTVSVTIEGGLPGELVSFDGDKLVLLSPRAFAPGAPLAFDVVLGDRTLSLKAKSHGSKRDEDGRFVVRGRGIGVRREDREAVVALLAS